MKTSKYQDFTKVSQYVNLSIEEKCDFLKYFAVVTTKDIKETEKAIGIVVEKWNPTVTKTFKTVSYFPKSQIIELEDDYYVDKSRIFKIPMWLINKKISEKEIWTY